MDKIWYSSENARLVVDFIDHLEQVPWFARLGRPSERDRELFRIYTWESWPGPEDPGSAMQSTYHRSWRKQLFDKNQRATSEQLESVWETVESRILKLARPRVPYLDDEDVWYAPNAAVWSLAQTASLVGCTLLEQGALQETIDPEMQWSLLNEWSWYVAGHWPCLYYWPWGYAELEVAERTGGAKRLVVF